MHIDKQDFEQAVREHSDAMLRCAYAYCGSVADAEDIVQEAFIKYLKKAPQFSDENHRKAWLLRVVINLSKNLTLSFRRRNKTDLPEELPDPSDPVKDSEVWLLVYELPAKYRILVELYYREGFTIREISEITGVRVPTVGKRLEKARQLLKNIYKEEQP